MKTYKASEIKKNLLRLPNWQYKNKNLVRVEKFPTYMKALHFVYKLGHAAEKADHHPDLIMNFRKVTIRFATHSENGITKLDFKMAEVAEHLIRKFL